MLSGPLESVQYWMSPVRSYENSSAEDRIQILVDRERVFAFGENTSVRKHIKSGDAICFYAQGKGVVAHARVSTKPVRRVDWVGLIPFNRYPWIIQLAEVCLYLNQPVLLDSATRQKLDVFRGKSSERGWQWFVVTTRRITRHDFQLLTRNC